MKAVRIIAITLVALTAIVNVVGVLVGMVLAVVQMTASRALHGKSMPTDLRLYVSLVTLLALLALGRFAHRPFAISHSPSAVL